MRRRERRRGEEGGGARPGVRVTSSMEEVGAVARSLSLMGKEINK